MENHKFNRQMAQLVLLQRIELANPFIKRLRKIFGRYLFSKVISKYFINVREISDKYFKLMKEEFHVILPFLRQNQKILSIGSGLGGLEIEILKKFASSKITFIEKNYTSDKIKYGWDYENKEGYNDLSLLEKLVQMNSISKDRYILIDYDEQKFPNVKFDLVISLYSLDYHYDINIYLDYLKKNTNENSFIIFDTIRPNYFEEIFENVKVIKENNTTVHKSKRLACRGFKRND